MTMHIAVNLDDAEHAALGRWLTSTAAEPNHRWRQRLYGCPTRLRHRPAPTTQISLQRSRSRNAAG